jgi:hypothetical protein
MNRVHVEEKIYLKYGFMNTKTQIVGDTINKYVYKIIAQHGPLEMYKILIYTVDENGEGELICTTTMKYRKIADAFVIHDGVPDIVRLAMKEYGKRFNKVIITDLDNELGKCKKILT